MSANTEPDWNVLQWLVTTLLGLLSFFYGFTMRNIYAELKDLKDRQNEMSKEMIENTDKGDNDLWAALKDIQTKLEQVAKRDELLRIQTAVDEERRLASTDRANIAVMMATKAELAKQLDKLFERLAGEIKNNR